MSKLLYYFVLMPISYLPFFLLYLLSDLLFFILYYIIGYRKEVVINNINNSFPDKDKAWVSKQTKLFYHHLADLIIETIKGFSISKTELAGRVKIGNTEQIDALLHEGRSIMMVCGHYNNWEMCGMKMSAQYTGQFYGLYAPLKDSFLDKKLKASRARFGLGLIHKNYAKRTIALHEGRPNIYVYIFDQSPASKKHAYWVDFLHQDTAVMKGTEETAKQFDLPVVFAHVKKPKRGHYEISFELLFLHAEGTRLKEISQVIFDRLEQDIIHHPPNWLWSHKRWKLNTKK